MKASQHIIHEIENVGWKNPESLAKKLQDAYLEMFEKLKQGEPCYIRVPLYKINYILEEGGFQILTPEEFHQAVQPPKDHSLRKRKTDNYKRLKLLRNKLFYDNR